MIGNQSQETQGITKQFMEKEQKENIKRIKTSAETGNPGRVGE